ncbi:MAG TPA: hypothetical protein PKH24_03370 [Sedimentisphaerales bacterium]|jgi:hypothetical protein|nr:hypothetical protein [Sedimentisphaerales bacterium]HNU28487.1 hypothetical protein [Sedimentisphaerales bacterium]
MPSLDAGDRPLTSGTFIPFLAVGMILVLAVAILANSMSKEIARDEQMYCTAGAMLAQGKLIYRDFSYPSQLPYHPLLLAACYKVLGTTHYLLVGRLVSVVSDVLVVLVILQIYRSVFAPRRTEGSLFGLAAAALYVFNPFVDYAAGYAWNHDVVILCVVAALWLLTTADFAQRTCWRVGLIGALLTAATCMRVTTALVEAVFLAAVLWMAGGSLKNRVRTALPFLAGALATLAWPAWVIAQAPEAFRLNLVRIPTLYGQWLHEIGMTFDKVTLTFKAFSMPASLVLLVLGCGLLWVGLRRRLNLDAQERRKALAAVVLPLVFLVIAYIPPTMWLQYLAVPVPFIAIALAYPLAAARRQASSQDLPKRAATVALPAAAGISILLDALVGSAALSRCVFALVPERWEPIRVHQVSQAMLERVKEPRRVLTLGPLYALEAGCDIYPELSSGSIVYRIADRMTPEERRITRAVGPHTIDDMVGDRPADAVIVGVELDKFSGLEDPLRRSVPSDWHNKSMEPLQAYWRP